MNCIYREGFSQYIIELEEHVKRIGIIGPSREELLPFIESLEISRETSIAGAPYFEANFGSLEIILNICGICKVNSAMHTQIMIDHFKPDALIMVGVSGAIAPLKIGDTVIGTMTAHHDVNQEYFHESYPFNPREDGYFESDETLLSHFREALESEEDIYFGKLVTGEYFVDQEGREHIIENFDPLSVDMETAAFTQVAFANKVPFITIRSITDTADESGIENFRKNFITSINRSLEVLRIALHFIERRNHD